ncbi:MAG: DedA family protein [Actinobacteria bacterium HGW-Actinobacteria-1]|jgi:undecaprenyl-diphosphatase|nr:MAG: DedA family protein [Actinobacteria bacterium HGW-Actinobacteria-1]
MLQYLLDLVARVGQWSYLIIFLIAALECAAFLGLLIPGESVLLACGFLAHRGTLMLDAVIAAAILGAIVGDNVGYAMGRRLGRGWLLSAGSHFGLTEQRLARSEAFFERHGGKAVFLGRFIGYARALVPFVAGTAEMPRRTFFGYNAAGAILWSSAVAVLGYSLGASWRLAEKWLGRASTTAGVAILAVAVTAWLLGRRARRRAE